MQSRLHSFDLQMCMYLRSNLFDACRKRQFRHFLEDELDTPLLNWLGLGEAQSDVVSDEELLLSAVDLYELEGVITGMPSSATWEPDQRLHRRKTLCVKELREELTSQDAQEWSQRSSEFAAQLESPDQSLAQGVEIVLAWIQLIRLYKRAMQRKDLLPLPEGEFPTPLHPKPAPVKNESKVEDAYITKGREGIRALGKNATKTAILHFVKGNKKQVFDALDVLREMGEYANPKSPRCKKNRNK